MDRWWHELRYRVGIDFGTASWARIGSLRLAASPTAVLQLAVISTDSYATSSFLIINARIGGLGACRSRQTRGDVGNRW